MKKKREPAPSSSAPGSSGSELEDDRRAELVRAAYFLIAEKGIEGLRTRDIAAKVGINISTLHYHFGTKEELITAVVEHVNHLFQTLRPPLRAGATSLDELRHMVETQTFRQKVAPELGSVIHETLLRARRDEHVRAAFDATLAGWRSAVEQLVARCIRDGYVRPNVDLKDAAEMVTACLIGMTMQFGVRPDSPSLREAGQKLISALLVAEATPSRRRR